MSSNGGSSRWGEASSSLPQRQNKWKGCFFGFTCFKSQKGGNRIVPASRIPDGNASSNSGNRSQSLGNSVPNATFVPSLLAPPSSPASFINSSVPSSAQSPSFFLSVAANSPGGPSSTMFATGPYAHETQLVTPPAFSTYTTEPSTAPLTPPHLTTPSSPDVPFARFLSSPMDFKSTGKANGMTVMSSNYSNLHATYALCPGSPYSSSSFISPTFGTLRTRLSSPFPEHESSNRWRNFTLDSPYSSNGSIKPFELDSTQSENLILSPDSSFFGTSTSPHFYINHARQSFPYLGGRSGVSRDMEIYSGGNIHSKACKQDKEEIEAYRASFGFSADDITSAKNYIEIPDVPDDSFTITPFPCSNSCVGNFQAATTGITKAEHIAARKKACTGPATLMFPESQLDSTVSEEKDHGYTDLEPNEQSNWSAMADSLDETFAKIAHVQVGSSRYSSGPSSSDVNVDYGRGSRQRDAKVKLACPNWWP